MGYIENSQKIPFSHKKLLQTSGKRHYILPTKQRLNPCFMWKKCNYGDAGCDTIICYGATGAYVWIILQLMYF